MGRHSAPDEPDDEDAPEAARTVRTRPDYRPRRARTDDPDVDPADPADDPDDHPDDGRVATDDDVASARIELLVDPDVDPDADPDAPVSERTEPAGAPSSGPAATDLDLLRGNPAVRSRVVAAVLVPFVLYTAVLFGLGAMSGRTYLIWIWVPLISAGVLAGLILDAAHRARGAGRAPQPQEDDAPSADDRS